LVDALAKDAGKWWAQLAHRQNQFNTKLLVGKGLHRPCLTSSLANEFEIKRQETDSGCSCVRSDTRNEARLSSVTADFKASTAFGCDEQLSPSVIPCCRFTVAGKTSSSNCPATAREPLLIRGHRRSEAQHSMQCPVIDVFAIESVTGFTCDPHAGLLLS